MTCTIRGTAPYEVFGPGGVFLICDLVFWNGDSQVYPLAISNSDYGWDVFTFPGDIIDAPEGPESDKYPGVWHKMPAYEMVEIFRDPRMLGQQIIVRINGESENQEAYYVDNIMRFIFCVEAGVPVDIQKRRIIPAPNHFYLPEWVVEEYGR